MTSTSLKCNEIKKVDHSIDVGAFEHVHYQRLLVYLLTQISIRCNPMNYGEQRLFALDGIPRCQRGRLIAEQPYLYQSTENEFNIESAST